MARFSADQFRDALSIARHRATTAGATLVMVGADGGTRQAVGRVDFGTDPGLVPEDPGNPFGLLGGALDPVAAFAELDDGLDTVTLEQRTVGKEAFQVYATVFDTAELSAEAAGTDAALLPETITFEWSFDISGHLRKVEADLGTRLDGFRYAYNRWGESEVITPPPDYLVSGAV